MGVEFSLEQGHLELEKYGPTPIQSLSWTREEAE